MHAVDVLAAAALAFGACLGARKGFWRLAAGGAAVSLGAAAGWAMSDVLAAALRDWGVGPPGEVVLGFFLPFALTSVYVRFIIGLWLARKLEGKPGRDRLLGAAAGLVWMVFAAGFAARAAGLDGGASARAQGYDPSRLDAAGDDAPPLTRWLARWPGELGARMYLGALARERRDEIAGTLKEAVDAGRARRRAAEADAEAITSVRQAGFIRLGVDPLVEAEPTAGTRGPRRQHHDAAVSR